MKKHFITGLVLLLPLTVTVLVLGFLIRLLTQPFVGLVSNFLAQLNIVNKGFLFLSPEQVIKYFSQFLILLTLFLFTICLGMITRWFFINALLRLGDKILHKIPIVNTVYKTTQEIIKTLFVSDKNTFKKVVLAPYPSTASYMLGLVAREAPPQCSKSVGDELISVLIPTTPNPTTGFLLMYRKKELVYLDMKPEDAIKCIVSCGVIHPGAVPPKPANKENF
ncbi:MAG: DUF502 domain-containing protein [Simkaniaceae bacterium]|nr:DUF502 domain-containing protein [Candidatus Sacchlamyda saccharinae]